MIEMVGELNTDVLIKYLIFGLIFGGSNLFTGLIIFFSTRWTYNDHHWELHLPKIMRINLKSRDNIIKNQKTTIAEQSEEIRDLKLKVGYREGIKDGEIQV